MLSTPSTLARQYYKLASETLPKLYALSLVEMVSNEKIDIEKTELKIEAALADEKTASDVMTIHRPKLMAWLNALFFNFDEMTKTSENEQVLRWWWEFEYRVRKAVTVATVLERHNLLRMGGKPEPSDIPQSLVEIYDFITQLKENDAYLSLRERHNKKVSKYYDKLFGYYLKK